MLALYALMVVLIASSALPIFKIEIPAEDEPDKAKSGPRWTRLMLFLLISLAFTQPLAVFLLKQIPFVAQQIER